MVILSRNLTKRLRRSFRGIVWSSYIRISTLRGGLARMECWLSLKRDILGKNSINIYDMSVFMSLLVDIRPRIPSDSIFLDTMIPF